MGLLQLSVLDGGIIARVEFLSRRQVYLVSLQLYRLENYKIQYIPTNNFGLHLYYCEPKEHGGVAASDRRFFMRAIIRSVVPAYYLVWLAQYRLLEHSQSWVNIRNHGWTARHCFLFLPWVFVAIRLSSTNCAILQARGFAVEASIARVLPQGRRTASCGGSERARGVDGQHALKLVFVRRFCWQLYTEKQIFARNPLKRFSRLSRPRDSHAGLH
jgi:hypothetical protein